MTNEELITEARKYAQYHGIKPYTEHIFKLLDALEAAEARVKELEAVPEPEWEERLAACDKHGTHCWSCMRHTERRRPAGEWHRASSRGRG